MPEDRTNPPAPASAPPAQVTTSPSGSRPTTAVTAGTRIIGTYEIERLINTGGMGEVYRGRNIHNGEPVAIKIVLPHLANDEMIVSLFQKEAKVLGRLFHEAIVRYHVFTNDPEIGRPCIVMEFVEGTSMNEIVKKGPMPLEDVKVLLRRLAGALDKAHTVGVVHRDLSPDNVILEDGQVSHAKIIDFGIAKSSMKGDATLLQGQFAGKFSYVAPEQLGAFGGTVDGRTDIYSLGLMMVAVCQGRVLNMGKSIVEAVRARGGVPDLSGVYPELRPLLEHMLEPNPENRPATMAQVARLVDHPEEIPGRAEDEDDGDRTRIITSMPSSEAQATNRTVPGVSMRGTLPKGGTAKPTPAGDVFVGIPSSTPKAKEEPKKSGKGGLVAVAAAVAVLGFGAAAYFAGVFEGEAIQQAADSGTTAPAGTGTAASGTTQTTATDAGSSGTGASGTGATTTAATDTAATDTTGGAAQTGTTASSGTDSTTTSGTAPATDSAATGTVAPAGGDAGTATETPPAEAPPLDARGQQLAWLRSYEGGPCVYLEPGPGGGDKVSIDGFATSAGPLAKLLSDFTAAHGIEPDLNTRVVSNPQCPVLDFAKRLQTDTAIPVFLVLDNPTGVVRSGEPVTGRIEGLAGRAVTLFSVNTEGATTNLKNFVTPAADGTLRFNFKLTLTDETEPVPQLLMALVTDQPVKRLDSLPAGVTARTLMPFIAAEADKARQVPIASLKQFVLQK